MIIDRKIKNNHNNIYYKRAYILNKVKKVI